MSFFLYAETAFHHEGDYAYLKSLVDIVAKTGCDGVKFQILIDLDDLMSSRHPSYQNAKNWVLSERQWIDILEYVHSRHLRIVAMPCDVAAVTLIEKLPFSIDFYDIHSVSFHDNNLFQAIKATGKPVILGVGGRTLEEIISSKEYFKEQLHILMVGFQAYPSDLKDVKLQKIAILKQLFPECLIGYADHTSYDSEYSVKSLEYAYILGARVFEKHITCAEGVMRVDHETAVGCEKMESIQKNLKYIDELFEGLPHEHISLSDKELLYRNRQKILVASKTIKAGETFTGDNISLKMTDVHDGYTNPNDIMGKVAKHDILFDESITREKILSND